MRRTNKIVVTGLALAADVDPEVCQSCNFDISWVFDYPSTLLWSDSIIITPTIKTVIDDGRWSEFPKPHRQAIADVIRLFFDKAGECGLVEVRDPTKEVDDRLKTALRERAATDRRMLAEAFPGTVALETDDKVPGGMRIESHHYCTPRVLSIYYSLLLAKAWRAEPLLNEHTHTYLKYAFGIRGPVATTGNRTVQAFQDVFREQLPEIDIRPRLGERNCWNCKSSNTCDRADLRQIAKRLGEYLKLRDYDEVSQMKELFARLARKSRSQSTSDFAEQLSREFRQTQRKLHRRLHKTFPVATRWTNLVTMLSIPVVVAGVAADSAVIAGIGAGIAGLSETAKHYMSILANRNRWMCFRQGCASDVQNGE